MSEAIRGDEIAIVGVAGRWPGATSPAELWANLRDGVESVRRFTEAELRAAGERADWLADPGYVKARPVLDGVDLFDAAFFGVSPQDAAIMDPQHRVFLEVGWEAFEDAGHDPERMAGQVGVFATCGLNSYLMHHLVTNRRLMDTVGEWLLRHTANDMNFLATRLSYELNLTGPSLNVQSACSSALVAVHLAAQSLINGECDMALAGGAVIALPQDRGYLFKRGEILSPDGHCRPFDAAAAGMLFGSGAGAVVLRRLADAEADGDHIYALIKGSAVNNDGSGKVGYLAPSVDGQAAAIAEALAISGVSPDSISYVEAHGAGTPVGDPIEMAALTSAYGAGTTRTGYCAVGSLKSNIGHLGEAAGIAGLIKTVLSLQHEQLPATLHFQTPNPQIDFASSPFFVNDRLRPWPRSTTAPRRAGVTSLGAGGTNVHAILQEAPLAAPSPASGAPQVLTLSARSPQAVAAASTRLAAHLEAHPAAVLDDVAFTLQQGRRAFAHRRAVVATTTAEAVAALREAGPERPPVPERAPSVVFMFPGQGAQYPQMGLELYASEPAYRAAFDECDRHYRALKGTSLRDLIAPLAGVASMLDDTSVTQPTLFAVEYALAQLWLSWGVEPQAMIGHSLGEYVAACVAGVMSVADAMMLVTTRGALMASMPRGAMMSVAAPVADVLAAIDGTAVSLGAANAPAMSVVSGDEAEVAAFAALAETRGWETKRLHISCASHSRLMDPILGPFGDAVRRVRLQPPTRPFVSNVTGTWIRADEATDPGYWVRHLRGAVRFADGIATILAGGPAACIEVGPGRTLGMLSRQQAPPPSAVVQSLRHAVETTPDRVAMRTAAGLLWTAGVAPDWNAMAAGAARQRVSLPTYPFERSRYWVDATAPGRDARAFDEGSTVKAPDLADWFHVPTWMSAPLATAAYASAAESDADATGHVLVFDDAQGLASAAARAWRTAHVVPNAEEATAQVFVVTPGSSFARVDDARFTIDPRRADDYTALLAAIAGSGGRVRHVVHVWTLDSGHGDSTATLDAGLEAAFAGPLAMLQALGAQEPPQPVHVTFVTAGTADVAGETALAPWRATLLGPALVAPHELAGLTARVVDITPAASERARTRLVSQLAAELGVEGAGGDSVVAYRGVSRYARRLITGGTGALGLALAEHLCRQVQARVVLVGRTTLPPSREWARLAADPATDPRLKQLVTQLLACQAAGGEVRLAAADVTDPAALRRVVDDTVSAFGALHGVVHAAGTLDDAPLQAKSLASARAVLDPKLRGAAALREVLHDRPLDFVVAYGSISSVLGLRGQVDYTAANAGLDAWASAWNAASDTPVRTIGWGPWREVGLATAAARARRRPHGTPVAHPWLGVMNRRGDDVVFATTLRREQHWLAGDHVVRGGESVVPGTGYLELMRAAVAQVQPGPIALTQVYFEAPLFVPAGDGADVTIVVRTAAGGTTVAVHSGDTRHAAATVQPLSAPAASIDVAAIAARCTTRVSEIHGVLPQPFMDFGPRWANLQRVRTGAGEALLELALPDALAGDVAIHALHPGLLDMATGAAQHLIPGFDQARDFYIPFSYGRVDVHAPLAAQLRSHVRLGAGTAHGVATFDVTIADEQGRVLVQITGFALRRVAAGLAAAAPQSVQRDGAPAAKAATLAQAMLREGMDTTEGLAAFARVLAHDAGPVVFVSTGSLEAWRARVDDEMRVELPSARAGGASVVAADAAFDDTERQLAAMWADLLGVSAVGPHDNFFDVGGHSLLGVRLLSRVEKAFGRAIPLGQLFEHATVPALASLVRGAAAPSAAPDDGITAAAEPAPTATDEPLLTRASRDSWRVKRSDLDRSSS